MFFFNHNQTPKTDVETAHLKSQVKDAVLIDVRETSEFSSGHAKGAINIPLSALTEKDAERLHIYKEVYVICQSGGRSARATTFLHDYGVKHAINVEGGTSMWRMKQLPME